MYKILSIYVGCHCCIIVTRVNAQDLDMIGKKTALEVSGGVSLNQIIYSAFGGQQRRDPYSYIASGNLNFSLYGWSIPLTFSVSNQGNSFQQPFNQYSLHPNYKTVHAHAGYISASYSPYSVSGHNFLGGAVDYEPEGKIKLSALAGRFLRAVELDSANSTSPVFERWGYGIKALYAGETNSVQVVLFRAKDDAQSVGYVPDSLNLNPQENLVISIGASTMVFKKFLLKGEVASSAVTLNTSAEQEERGDIFGRIDPLFTTRTTTGVYNAYKGNFDYQHTSFTVGLGYERIDPDYKTFGAYYFNSDLENVTMNASTSLLEGKVSLTGSIGKQHDNLDSKKVSTLERTVGSLSASCSPSEKIAFSMSYSTFQSFTNIRSQFEALNQLSPYENNDTLNFTQLSKSASFTSSYAFGKNAERKQNVNINFSAQGASERQGDVNQNSGTWFYNLNTVYSINLQQQNTVLSISLNGSVNDGVNSSKTFGPIASASRSFYEKKLRANLSFNYNETRFLNASSNALNGRVGAALNIKKKHNVNANVGVQSRRQSNQLNRIFEMTANVGYNYSFAWKKD